MTGPSSDRDALPTRDRRAGVALALLVAGAFFMENLDATVIVPALPHMAASFQVAPVDLSAGVSAYMLALGVFIPASGWIADRCGARRVFAAAVAIFTLASLFCSLAQSLEQFVAARVLQGVGGAMMVPVGRLVVLRETSKERLIGAIALLTWPALVAPVLGPPLGGLIADHGHWRWIFYLNVPLGIAALLLALLLVPNVRGARRRFDWPGFALTGAGLAAVLAATEAFARAPAEIARSGPLAATGLALLALGIVHLRRSPAPMIELSALRVPTFAVAIRGGSLLRMGVSAVPFLLPLLLQLGFGFSAAQAGAMLMAVFAGNLVMKPFTTPVLRRFGFKRVLVCNGLLNVLSIAACALFTRDSPLLLMCGVLFAGGMARSMQFTTLNTIAFADVPAAAMSGANTLFSTAFQLAMGLGIALGALALRASTGVLAAAAPAAGADLPYRLAFVAVAAVSLIGLYDCLRLPRAAGAAVIGRV